jgi:hypothetical protein
MALTAGAVRVGVTGRIYVAPQGTAIPTATSGVLASGFNDMGYAKDDGITISVENDTTDIRAWQNGDLVRRVQSSVTFSIQFVMIETNEYSLKTYFNNYTHGAGVLDGSVTMNGSQPFRGAVVLDVIDGTNLIRVAFPDAQVTDRGDITIVNGDALAYDVTMAGYPDSAGNAGYIYVASDAAS